MKKIALFIFMGLFAGSVIAQDPGATEKNAGNAAWKAKNYKEAFVNFEKYLATIQYKDNAYIYNTAVAAVKIKNYAAAEKYFEMAIKNNYKLGNSYLGKAQAEEDLKKEADMIATLEAGLKAIPGNVKLESMYGSFYLKKGIEAQKANNVEAASANYMKLSTLTNKELRTKAFTALGSLYFNNGATILQKATPLANTEKDKYEAEKTKAFGDFTKAKDYLTQAIALSPEDADVKELLKQVNAAMK